MRYHKAAVSHPEKLEMSRVGQYHIYTVCIRYFWQGNQQIYGHIRCIYTVLASPRNESDTVVPVKAYTHRQSGADQVGCHTK